MNPMQRRGLNQYQKVAIGTEVSFASPHRLIQMLMEGALDKIACAKGQIERNDFAKKGRNITQAISIIQGLNANLDTESGGDIVAHLERLYDYMVRRLLEASVNNDVAILDEVTSLLKEVKSAWDGMPIAVKQDNPATATTSVGKLKASASTLTAEY